MWLKSYLLGEMYAKQNAIPSHKQKTNSDCWEIRKFQVVATQTKAAPVKGAVIFIYGYKVANNPSF